MKKRRSIPELNSPGHTLPKAVSVEEGKLLELIRIDWEKNIYTYNHLVDYLEKFPYGIERILIFPSDVQNVSIYQHIPLLCIYRGIQLDVISNRIREKLDQINSSNLKNSFILIAVKKDNKNKSIYSEILSGAE